MLDKHTYKISQIALRPVAFRLHKWAIPADHITIAGFIFGIACIGFVSTGLYYLALPALIVNRILDGLDGALARMNGTTLAGGFLDITLDFLFYSGFVFSFGLSQRHFLLPAIVLLFSFFGTGISFLAFASLAAKYNLQSPQYPNKSLYYMGGLTEGTETIAIFIFMVLFPPYFALMAYLFAMLCFITTAGRIVFGYQNLRRLETKYPKQKGG